MSFELLASGERDAEAVLLPAIERLLEALVASPGASADAVT